MNEYFQQLVEHYRLRLVASPDKPNESPEATIRGLWLCACGVPVSADAAMHQELPALTPESREKLLQLLDQRERGIPLAYLTGRQRFMGLDYICSNQALIPRKETEILGEAVRALFNQKALPGDGPIHVLDLCTGSGNLACAIATHYPASVVFGVDISSEAIELAATNARHLGCSERVKLVCGDLFVPFESPRFHNFFDLIMCNPPYIDPSKLPSMAPEIIDHEPKLAFDGGPLGMRVLWRLLQDAPRFMKAGGWLAFEVGVGQGTGMLRRLSKNPHFANAKGLEDGAGNVRAIVGQLKSNALEQVATAAPQANGIGTVRTPSPNGHSDNLGGRQTLLGHDG